MILEEMLATRFDNLVSIESHSSHPARKESYKFWEDFDRGMLAGMVSASLFLQGDTSDKYITIIMVSQEPHP